MFQAINWHYFKKKVFRMTEDPNNLEPNKPANKSSNRAIAGLILAFMPSAIMLTLGGVTAFRDGHSNLFLIAAIVSVVCCFTSSFLLFRHKTTWAIVIGVLFVLLNAVISLFLGCAALLTAR
jgi:hypothetical protein